MIWKNMNKVITVKKSAQTGVIQFTLNHKKTILNEIFFL